MGVVFYNIFLVLLKTGIRVASLFDHKARKWVRGRKNIFEKLEKAIPAGERIIWVHCASLGEFEQGRPLMEKLREEAKDNKILLTFFSPSGYEIKKDYAGADWIYYLPVDGPKNARRFLEIVRPVLVIFVKYEFWYFYLKKIKYRNIPLLLVSALFRKDMSFFKWYGGLQRKMLSRFDHLFVQNEDSRKLIAEIGLGEICSVSGDTRFDRVIQIAEKFEPIPLIQRFVGNSKTIVAGSTWKIDEEALQKMWSSINDPSIKMIIAPHEITEAHLTELKNLFPNSLFYSQLADRSRENDKSNILIIDNIGMLSRLYYYAYITYVGGGLASNGVHNVLEAAVYDKPVIIGPYYEKYIEAVALVKTGGAIVIKDGPEIATTVNTLLTNAGNSYDRACNASAVYVLSNKGATERIMQFIHEKRLLTN